MQTQKTKIVATIGPKTANEKLLKKMALAGMSIARLNGSHNTLDWHSKVIKLIKRTLPDCPILLDIPGKKIRTVKLDFEPEFKIGDEIILTTEKGQNGKDKVSITNNKLHNFVSKGDTIFADDGTLKFSVTKVDKKDIYIKAKTAGKLKSSKGINVPHVNIGGNFITNRDKKMIAFAILNKVDLIGLSFIDSEQHLIKIKKLLKGNIPKIVAKIENRKGVENLYNIVREADCIMIDRGDLSTETNIETLGINQKKIIKACLENSKPVIVATEMLNNMISSPYPTKAEVLDICNSVEDGATATMLSGETAVGKFPVEAIEVMAKISNATISQNALLKNNSRVSINTEAIGMGKAIKSLCESLQITKIVVVTVSGFAARIIASQRLPYQILAVSNNKDLARGFNVYLGTKGIYFNTHFYKNSLEHIPRCLQHLWKINEINKQDKILVTALAYPSSNRRMNIIQTHYVKDLMNTFSWK